MHVLIAPDSFSGTLTATQAAEAMADGWRRTAPGDLLTLMPLSDGGPGFLDVMTRALEGRTVAVTVADPLGREVPAAVMVEDTGTRRTAYLETAQAAGLHLLAADERNPALTSTLGVGHLIEAALAEGAERLVIGLGGNATNDGGAGMLAALGVGDPAVLGVGGLALAHLADDALTGIDTVRSRLSGVDIVLATDVDAPLLGFSGASAVYAPQKGASPELAQELEGALGRFREVLDATVGHGLDLLSGAPRRLDRLPGAGAAGGLAYALMVLGGERVSAVDLVLGAVRFREVAAAADLVLTGEGTFDWESQHGSVIAGVAAAALEVATPTVVLAGQSVVGRREAMAMGVSGCYAVAQTPEQVAAAHTDPVGTLTDRAARIASTWSPKR